MSDGYVYIAYCKDTNLIKVGATSDVKRRMREISSSSGFEVECCWSSGLIGNHFSCESIIKSSMGDRMVGEWYCQPVDLAVELAKSVVANSSTPKSKLIDGSDEITNLSQSIAWSSLAMSNPEVLIKLVIDSGSYDYHSDAIKLSVSNYLVDAVIFKKDAADKCASLISSPEQAMSIISNGAGCAAFVVVSDAGVYSFVPDRDFEHFDTIDKYLEHFKILTIECIDDLGEFDCGPFEFCYDFRSDKSVDIYEIELSD